MENQVTRTEHYLSKLLGSEQKEMPSPVTRSDHYLHYMVTKEGELPEPVTRTDCYLYELAQKGASGGGSSGMIILNKIKTISLDTIVAE